MRRRIEAGPSCCLSIKKERKEITKQLYTESGECKCFKTNEQQCIILGFLVVVVVLLETQRVRASVRKESLHERKSLPNLLTEIANSHLQKWLFI